MNGNQEKPETIDPELWVDHYGDYLYRYASSRLRDTNAAEEVLQETFLAGIRFVDQFSGKGSQRGWLLGILKRKIIDYVRMRSRYDRDNSQREDGDHSSPLFGVNGSWSDIGVSLAAPDQNIELQELWQIVRECLGNLPVGQADVFTLSVMEEMEAEEICRNLEITPNNLWVRLHRARLGLASCVGSRWFREETEATKHAQ